MLKSASLSLALLAFAAAPGFADSAELTPGAWSPSNGDVISYKVLRKGNDFGTHTVSFEEAGEELKATTRVRLKAGLGPITVFKYELDATETWKDGQLVAVTGRVNDDGTKGSVSAKRAEGQLTVDGTVYSGAAPGDIIPASHWNKAQTLQNKLLSTEDGELIDVAVTPQGQETLTIDGQQVQTTKYLMDSDIDVELWYDTQGRWVKLAFEARGQDIEYVLTELY